MTRINKSSEKLTSERNERLAIANRLYYSGGISKEKFISLIIATRRCYKDEIKDQIQYEIRLAEKESKEKGLKSFFNKKIYKICKIKLINLLTICMQLGIIRSL